MKKYMRSTRRGWMIFNEADKGGPTAGAAAPAAEDTAKPAVADPPKPVVLPDPPKPAAEPAAVVEAAVPAAKPSVFQKAGAMLKDKSELLGTISAHEGTIAALTAQLGKANQTIQAQNAMLADMKKLEETVAELEKGKTSVELAAATQVAALGFPAKDLPAASSAEAADTDAPTSMEDFQKKHSELTAAGKADEASKFYSKYAKKFGL